MALESEAPAMVTHGPGREDRHANAADLPSVTHERSLGQHPVPVGLRRSPFANDGGELIGRDPRDLSADEWCALQPDHPIGLAVIRAKCLDCCHSQGEVRRCTATSCPLWPFRMGTVPKGYRDASRGRR